VAAVPNLASAAGWLTISQSSWLIVNQPAAGYAACIKGQQSWRDRRREQRHSVAVRSVCVWLNKRCHRKKPLGAWLILGAGGGKPGTGTTCSTWASPLQLHRLTHAQMPLTSLNCGVIKTNKKSQYFQRGSRSPRQLCMGSNWWRHWAKLGVCRSLSLDCCINLSALQCSTTFPFSFLYLPSWVSLSLSLSLSTSRHFHTEAWQRNDLERVSLVNKKQVPIVEMIESRKTHKYHTQVKSKEVHGAWGRRSFGREHCVVKQKGKGMVVHRAFVWKQLHASFTHNSTYSKKGFLSYLPRSTNRSKWPNMAIPVLFLWGWVWQHVISYLQAIHCTVDHTQEHHSPDGLHDDGALVHLLPGRRMLTRVSEQIQ